MLALAFWLLLAAALGGLFMAALGATAPVRLIHGLIAGLGLLCLLIGAVIGAGGALAWASFGVVAAGFGAGALFFGALWRDSAPPRILVYGHGVLNGAGLVLLGVAVF